MLRMSKLTDYGTVVLADLAARPAVPHSATDVAEHTRLSVPTVSKLLKVLAKAGLVTSYRGSHGGYVLARSADDINAAEIIDVLDGPVAITECSSEHSECELEPICGVRSAWQRISLEIRRALADISLRQLIVLAPGKRTPMTLDAGLKETRNSSRT